jgi:hypothetical protein
MPISSIKTGDKKDKKTSSPYLKNNFPAVRTSMINRAIAEIVMVL